jgi:hypothetical protein
MKGYRFYAEMPEARKSKSASKANPFFPWTVAALTEAANNGRRFCVAAVELDESGRLVWNGGSNTFGMVAPAIDQNPHSYGYCSGTRGYLAKRCTRIPESLARVLSPELFRYLEL